MRILGIETSCDETAASVVEDGKTLLSSVIASSVDLHTAYGGVVPEIAARSHLESITPVIKQALSDADKNWDDIDAIGVTYGPGLSGSLLIGVMTARTLAIAKNKPLYAVDHVEAHVYATFLTSLGKSKESRIRNREVTQNSQLSTPHSATQPSMANYAFPKSQPIFPLLALIVSGGHTQLVLFKGHFDYIVLGQTADDAIGEAFDKVAKILGLTYPGGPSISVEARNGNLDAVPLPKAKMQNSYDFSFSGLKTAVLRASQTLVGKDYTLPSTELAGLLSGQQKADIAASFQKVALQTVIDATKKAINQFSPASLVVAGGVASSPELRRMLSETIDLPLFIPDIKLCTDNAAMIAVNAYYQASLGRPPADSYKLEIDPNLSM